MLMSIGINDACQEMKTRITAISLVDLRDMLVSGHTELSQKTGQGIWRTTDIACGQAIRSSFSSASIADLQPCGLALHIGRQSALSRRHLRLHRRDIRQTGIAITQPQTQKVRIERNRAGRKVYPGTPAHRRLFEASASF